MCGYESKSSRVLPGKHLGGWNELSNEAPYYPLGVAESFITSAKNQRVAQSSSELDQTQLREILKDPALKMRCSRAAKSQTKDASCGKPPPRG